MQNFECGRTGVKVRFVSEGKSNPTDSPSSLSLEVRLQAFHDVCYLHQINKRRFTRAKHLVVYIHACT